MMKKVTVHSVPTGESREIYIGDGDGGLVNAIGDGFSPSYIHSELFGGEGEVTIEGDPPVVARVRALLSRHPQVPDRRLFGRCGSY